VLKPMVKSDRVVEIYEEEGSFTRFLFRNLGLALIEKDSFGTNKMKSYSNVELFIGALWEVIEDKYGEDSQEYLDRLNEEDTDKVLDKLRDAGLIRDYEAEVASSTRWVSSGTSSPGTRRKNYIGFTDKGWKTFKKDRKKFGY